MDKDKMELIGKIAKRADEMGMLFFDRLSLIMDLECVCEQFDMDLPKLLLADDVNFAHDIRGIQQHLDRKTRTMQDCFFPRYAK